MNTNINTSTNYYDIIIIGSGIAGLYSALNVKQMSPKTSFMVLEKYKKKWNGGRLNNEEFYGTTIVTGAGIGRKEKDHLLVEVLEKMNIEPTGIDAHFASAWIQINSNLSMKYKLPRRQMRTLMLELDKDKSLADRMCGTRPIH